MPDPAPLPLCFVFCLVFSFLGFLPGKISVFCFESSACEVGGFLFVAIYCVIGIGIEKRFFFVFCCESERENENERRSGGVRGFKRDQYFRQELSDGLFEMGGLFR